MHKSVLLQEALDALDIVPSDVVLDGTVGEGGHAEAILYAGAARVIGVDLDADALLRAGRRLAPFEGRVRLIEGNFRDARELLGEDAARVTKILLDLGWSATQLDESGRGFSFRRDEPLLMTLSKKASFNAADLLNGWSEEDIQNVFKGYGEERKAAEIAREIVTERKKKPFRTTKDLVETVGKIVPRRGPIHPATRVFQALRIAVNDELRNVREGLPALLSLLPKGGRIAVISFHSLEDRMVKNIFRETAGRKEITILTKRPFMPQPKEIWNNPRARSAKLRAAEKI